MIIKKKVAIVYDWIDKWGGVERVLLALHSMFPKASLFTSCYDADKAKWARNIDIVPSFINRLPFIRSNRLLSFFLYPLAFESFDFSHYDIVISVSSSFAKSIITKPGTLHICYLLTPTRYLWIYPENYISSSLRLIFSPILNQIKEWDKIASNRPDKFISISKLVSKRSFKTYQKKTDVIYPPFDTTYWKNIKIDLHKSFTTNTFKLPKNFFLVVSRLEPYKKIDLLVKTFTKVKKNLIIVGKGSQLQRIKSYSGNTIQFLQDLSDKELAFLYQHAEATIMPQEEDFGYVAVEAQFMGCPVISYSKSGVSEIIAQNKTGIFFHKQSVQSIRKVLERFDQISYNLKRASVQYGEEISKKFDFSNFQNKLHVLIQNL
ncbi:hypothetical protein COY87_01325 [Candidatus Roizmanbacteria bacterium CG_4_10_14_0_8_um_filter_33_9]|uniref:Glycosyl transferase family 1 domain-containing protein n=1 Tax=Candidatus Roizmanbacteria bacterium CG_4_10_14_0_8_um_filter_33_9 TaxID=1974826 RepID=A0A2M7QJ76_9BACT|nr:MAG: hypothetical protein COY87_01325 [Candidatus Roizmanbacteria bacterium CG_4_10_14_0_8_um_filter_33_9]